jgi:hypothetical protein
MGMAAVKAELELEEWKGMIQDCQNSGKTITEWCAEHYISKSSYYYRQRMLRQNAYATIKERENKQQLSVVEKSEPEFVEIKQPETSKRQKNPAGADSNAPAITIYIGEASAHIHNGADADVIAYTVNALGSL